MKLQSIGWATATLCLLAIQAGAQGPPAYPPGYAPPPAAVHAPVPDPHMPIAFPPQGMPPQGMPPQGVVPPGYSGHPGLVPLPHPGGDWGSGWGEPVCGACDSGCCQPGSCDHGCCDDCCEDCGFGRLGTAGFHGGGLLDLGCHDPEGGGWRARAEAILLTCAPRRRPVTSLLDDEVILAGGDLQFDYEAGVRLSFERCLWCNHGLEISYFGLPHWSDARTAGDGTGGLLSDYEAQTGGNATVPVYNNASNHTIAYGSELHSAEVNYWLPACCGWCQASFGVGVRCFYIEEDFNFSAVDFIGDSAVTAINADNLLIGPQVATTLWFPFNKCIGLRIDGKFAILNNNAEQRTSIDVFGTNPSSFRESIDTSKASVAGEVSMAFMVQVSCNVAMFFGYDAIFMEGLVLAPEQFNNVFPTTGGRSATIHDSASRQYHGPSAGVEMTW